MNQNGYSLAGYDFADFGCSSGGSMKFAQEKLGGTQGVGLDIDPKKVAVSRAAGFRAEVADVAKLDPKELGTVRFVIMAHFLEHLPNLETAAKCIESAVKVSDEFVFIRQPYFDGDDYLKALGLKPYWSDWHGHRNHMTSQQFRQILDGLLAKRRFRGYTIFNRTKILDSSDTAIHPIDAPRDQHAWNAAQHGQKPYFKFAMPVYREIGALIHTRARKLSEPPRRFLLHCDVAYASGPR